MRDTQPKEQTQPCFSKKDRSSLMGVISKPCCSCSASDEASKQSANSLPPSPCFNFPSTVVVLPSNLPPVHCPFGTADGLSSAVLSERAPTMSAHDRFTFGEIPTTRILNSAVLPEKAPTPAPNGFTFCFSRMAGSDYAVMPEKAPMPAPNRFTFGVIPTVGGSCSAVLPEKPLTPAPNGFTFPVSLTVGGSDSAVMPEKPPTPAPNGFTFPVSLTVCGSDSAVMPEKPSTPAPNGFTFPVSPTVGGSNSSVIPEKAPTPAPNRFIFGVSPTVSGSDSAVMPEKQPTPVPNGFTFPVSLTVGGSDSAVMPEKPPTPASNGFTFPVSPTVGGSNSSEIPEKAPTPAPNRFIFSVSPTVSGSDSEVMPEKPPTPAPKGFTFLVSPTVGGSNSSVIPEKALTVAHNRFTFGVSPTVGGSDSAVIPENPPTSAPNHFTFPVSPTVGGSNSSVILEKTPMPATKRLSFGVIPTVGELAQQDQGKSKCSDMFESLMPAPILFSMSETPAFCSPGFGDLFRENVTTLIPSPSASVQCPTVKDSCTHGPFPSNLFANNPAATILQNSLSRIIFPPPSENHRQNQIPFVNPPVCTTAPIFSWTTLPGFNASRTRENCRKEKIIPFAQKHFRSDGPFEVLHSISALTSNGGGSHEELRWAHYQNNNPMLGKVPVMMLPVIPMAGGGFAFLTVQSNIVQPSTIHQATEVGASSTFP